jgi:hypothetical protein
MICFHPAVLLLSDNTEFSRFRHKHIGVYGPSKTENNGYSALVMILNDLKCFVVKKRGVTGKYIAICSQQN